MTTTTEDRTVMLYTPGCSCRTLPRYHTWNAKIMFPVAVNAQQAFDIIEQAIESLGWTLRGVNADELACSPEDYAALSNVHLEAAPFQGFEAEVPTPEEA